MNQPLPPWSLHWSSNGELSPIDRADLAHLFLALHHPPLAARQGISSTGTALVQVPSRIYHFPTVKT